MRAAKPLVGHCRHRLRNRTGLPGNLTNDPQSMLEHSSHLSRDCFDAFAEIYKYLRRMLTLERCTADQVERISFRANHGGRDCSDTAQVIPNVYRPPTRLRFHDIALVSCETGGILPAKVNELRSKLFGRQVERPSNATARGPNEVGQPLSDCHVDAYLKR